MKRGFKKFLALSIITLCGLSYYTENKEVTFLGTSSYEINKSENHKENIKKEDEKLLLVNKDKGLEKNYIPKGLTVPNIPFVDKANEEEKQVAGIVKKPLEKLVKEAKKEGIILIGNSAYRGYKSQKKVYDSRVKSKGKELADAYVAKPGFSEHQTGLCIDVTNKEGYFAKGTKEAEWVAENSYKFGFIIRYPEGGKSITGIEYEPWHIRYVGEENAKAIYNNGITLEEYLGQ